MIDEDLLNTLVDLMLESVETSSQIHDKENVMFFTWLYDELVELPKIKNARKFAQYNKNKILKQTNKDTITDEEIKMLHYLNSIIKATTTSKNKNLTDKQKHARRIIKEETQKIKKDVSQHMSLPEVKQYLLDDETLTNQERFDLYYQEHHRIKKEKQEKKDAKDSVTYEEMMKNLGIKPSNSGEA